MKKFIIILMLLLVSSSAFAKGSKLQKMKCEDGQHIEADSTLGKKDTFKCVNKDSGPQGIPGIAGPKGTPGNSIVGPQGEIGPQGTPGVDGINGTKFVMKDANGIPFGNVLSVSFQGTAILNQIEFIINGISKKYDFTFLIGSGLKGIHRIMFTGPDCSGDVFTYATNSYFQGYRPAFGETPILATYPGRVPIYIAIDNIGVDRNAFSYYDNTGCRPISDTISYAPGHEPDSLPESLLINNSILIEEVISDFNVEYPYPYTLEIE